MTEERFEQIEKIVTANKIATVDLYSRFKALEREWIIYENGYREYLAKRDRLKRFLWWLFCKITFRSIKLTKKELTKRTAKKMASIFYERNRK